MYAFHRTYVVAALHCSVSLTILFYFFTSLSNKRPLVGCKAWVPADVVEQSSVTMEFCCAPSSTDAAQLGSGANVPKDFVWVGMIRRTVPGTAKSKKHQARIVFLREGNYLVSACAKFSNALNKIDDDDMATNEEAWWAPLAENVQVGLLQ